MLRGVMLRDVYAIPALVIGFVVWTSVPRPAEAGELQLEGHGAGQHAYDPSFDPLGRGETPNVFASGTIGVGYEIGDHVGLDGLFAYGALSREGSGQAPFDDAFEFGWRRGLYLVGAEYGYDFGMVRPFVRVTAGLARQRLTMSSDGGTTFADVQTDFATRNSIGVAFHTPYAESDGSSSVFAISEHVSIGLTLESGYLWQVPADFDQLSAPSAGDDGWTRSGIDLGTLDASGWFWAVGAAARLKL